MKKNFRLILSAFALLIFGGLMNTAAQTDSQFTPNNQNPTAPTAQTRPNLLRELDLSKDQLLEIRRLNQEKKPLMQEAQRSLREANQQLDEAIYADTIDENLIQSRLLAVQKAHSEVLRIRSNSETAVRKVLNPDQLVKFRQIRRRFEQTKAATQTRREEIQNRPNAPVNALQNRRIKRQQMRVLNNGKNTQ